MRIDGHGVDALLMLDRRHQHVAGFGVPHVERGPGSRIYDRPLGAETGKMDVVGVLELQGDRQPGLGIDHLRRRAARIAQQHFAAIRSMRQRLSPHSGKSAPQRLSAARHGCPKARIRCR